MSRKRRVWTHVRRRLAALTLCAASAAVAGQTAKTVEVVVPVTVTDASGRAVAGLVPEMFRAEVDGVPVETESFTASHELAAAIVFAPGVVERWGEIRDGAAEAIRKGGGSATIVFSRDEPNTENASVERVQFAGRRIASAGRETSLPA